MSGIKVTIMMTITTAIIYLRGVGGGCFPGYSDGKESPARRETGNPSLVRRSPGEGDGNMLQYCCLENPVDRGAWWAFIWVPTQMPDLGLLGISSKSS